MATMTVQDPRVARTRRAIIDAARAALLDGDADRLTLSDIATRAGYSRRAAYANFTDVHGIIRAVTLDALELPEGEGGRMTAPLAPDELRRRILQVLIRIEAERDVLLRIAQLPSQPGLTDALRDVVDEIFDRSRIGMGLGSADDIHAAFLVGGCVNVLRGWIEGSLSGTPEQLADTATALIALIGARSPSGA
ncbi:TetR-like C-terminal domain-containing protein [Occultella aeris]|uniref:Bacterial regulatory proteins, tetR family n=2 Tax=Occultella aeris TaxID=2761496 RepID=A0A7M4DGH6_9MICO|nr:Bacterial regulatory proteins, tetR family [Occultella aeris]